MKSFTLLLISLILISACNEDKLITKIFSETQKVSIYTYEDVGNKRTKSFVFGSDLKGEISKLAEYISSESSPDYKCGYDGIIELQTNRGNIDMEYNLMNDCRHIVFIYEEKRYTRKLTDAGWEYLKSLRKK
jgi:hypothetical protein